MTLLLKSRAWTYASASTCQSPQWIKRRLASSPSEDDVAPAKRSTRSSRRMVPLACTSVCTSIGATARKPVVQSRYAARTVAGTRSSAGVVEKPSERS